MRKILLSTIATTACAASLMAQPNEIVTEYFFDKDPGFGKGKVAGVSENGTQNFNADLTGLKEGFHTLNVRGHNIFGWSHTVSFQFMKFDKTSEILGTEYFFNEDPGFGKGVYTDLTGSKGAAANTSTASININLEKIQPGYHILNVRAQNADKTWTSPISSPFIYQKSPEKPKAAEYYFDHDPGEGNGFVIKNDGNNLAFTMNTEQLKNGNHILYVRSQDELGNWNTEEITPFTLQKNDKDAKADWSIPIYISPNPAQYSFTIQFGKKISENDSVTVSVYSQSGKEVSHENYAVKDNIITISTAPYSSGSYLVTVAKDWLSTSKRLVIKKRTADDETTTY